MNDRDERPRDDAGADQPGGHEPVFDDPTHAWVRDLLADARVTTPPPADVVARLDDTLAALGAERARSGLPAEEAEEEPAAIVVPLRRRLRPRLAAAAAAVIVVAAGGVALTRLDLGSTPSSDSAASGAADSATVSTASPSVPGSAKGLATGSAPQALADSALPPLSTASFAADAAAVMRRVAADQAQLAGSAGSDSSTSPAPAQTPGDEPHDPALAGESSSNAVQAPPVTATPESLRAEDRAQASAACAGPAVAGAVTLPAMLDGARVALVFRPPTADGQRVEAWSCDGTTVLAAATVAP